jgi:hypothetical protein
LHVTSIRAAEMLKYACNNFHALKITFANETARLCGRLVSILQVMDLVCSNLQLNLSSLPQARLRVRRSCLPKAPPPAYLARMRDVELPMLASIWRQSHADASWVLSSGKRRIDNWPGIPGPAPTTCVKPARARAPDRQRLEPARLRSRVHLSNLLGASASSNACAHPR